MPLSRIDIALRQIEDWIGPAGVPGAAAVVWQNGTIVAEHYAGEARTDTNIDESTLFALASVTKPITAAVVLSLQQEGTWSIDDPVSTWLPEFMTSAPDDPLAALRSTITIRQLLCHLSGLPEDLPKGTFRSRRNADARGDCRQLPAASTAPTPRWSAALFERRVRGSRPVGGNCHRSGFLGCRLGCRFRSTEPSRYHRSPRSSTRSRTLPSSPTPAMLADRPSPITASIGAILESPGVGCTEPPAILPPLPGHFSNQHRHCWTAISASR